MTDLILRVTHSLRPLICFLVALSVLSTTAWAQPATAESTAAANLAFRDAADFQNNGAYDLAAEAWAEFLKQHAGDPKALDAKYNLAVCAMQLSDLEQASQYLQEVTTAKEPFGRREEALLNYGWTLYSQALQDQPAKFTEADAAFAVLLKEFPDGTKRDQALFFQGESFYLQERRDEAIKAYERVIEEFPDSPLQSDAAYALGVALEEMDRFEDAGRVYDRFTTQFPDHELGNEVKMRKAETVLRSGDFADAEKRFAEVAALPGFDSADHALYRQAFAVASQKRFADAATLFSQLVDRFPDSSYAPAAEMAAARSYYRAEKDEESAERFAKVLKFENSDELEAAHWLARLYLKQGQAQAALQLLEKYIPKAEMSSFKVNLLMDQADALYATESEEPAAVALYSQIAKDHPEHALAPQALYNAAFGAMELKDHQQSIALADQFLKNHADNQLAIDVKSVAAESNLQSGNHEAAARIFAELLADLADKGADRPEISQWRIREALALFGQQKYAESLERVENSLPALELPGERAEAYMLAGRNQFAQGEFAAAEKAFQQSLESLADWRQADETWLFLSRAQRKLDKLDEARESISQLISEFPQSSVLDQAHFRLAEYAYSQGDFEAANQEYKIVIDDYPESVYRPYALYGRGWSNLRERNLADAERNFTALIEQTPEHKLVYQALYARGMSRQQAGEFKKALADVATYLENVPDETRQADGLYIRGLSQAGLKQLDEAIATFESIVQKHPEYAGMDRVLYELAWAQKDGSKNEDAIATFRQLTEAYPASGFVAESLYHLGEASYAAKDYKNAADLYERARSQVSGNPDLAEKVLYKLGWSNYQRKQVDAALASFVDQVKEFPEGKLLGDAHFMQGECQFQTEKYDQALTAYAAATAHPLSSNTIKTLAHLHAGQAAAQLEKWQESLEWLEKINQDQPQSAFGLEIKYEMAWAQQNLGNLEVAEQLYGDVAANSRGPLKARAGFMLGELKYAQKEYADAIRQFRKVMYGFGEDAPEQVRDWQAKAGFEAGQCAGILASQRDKPADRERLVTLAKLFFTYVVERHPNSDEAKAASRQLEEYET
ncbi:MAG: hypothetical protein CMJ77_23830 [Planctomycetaceae bacterium]|nr:hypothetical protein [Planctomycetaceae bacterium]